jgi:hypothetical protein
MTIGFVWQPQKGAKSLISKEVLTSILENKKLQLFHFLNVIKCFGKM